MGRSVLVGAARTPVGRFGGGLQGLPAVELGAIALREALLRSGVEGSAVEYVIMGHVLQAGQGQITARQAAVKAGIPMEVPALTVNKVCISGLAAVALADQLIRAGEVSLVAAGGMESMSGAPYLLPRARWGLRMGSAELVDAMVHDGLWCAFLGKHMGELSDEVNRKLGIGREEQDAWALRSHQRAHAAWEEGRFKEEVVAVEVPGQRQRVVVERDEGIRPETSLEALAGLRPAFLPDGTITAGNASQISDGAAALVVASEERARAEGLPVLARILAHGMVAGPDPTLHHQPAGAIKKALEKLGMKPGDLNLVEINEAFAAVALHSTRLLGVSEEVVNVNGGAVALGHPIGASGARILVTLVHELRRRGGGIAAAALCGGGGQGDALVLEVLPG